MNLRTFSKRALQQNTAGLRQMLTFICASCSLSIRHLPEPRLVESRQSSISSGPNFSELGCRLSTHPRRTTVFTSLPRMALPHSRTISRLNAASCLVLVPQRPTPPPPMFHMPLNSSPKRSCYCNPLRKECIFTRLNVCVRTALGPSAVGMSMK